MSIGDDKTQLLNQLKIDRNVESSSGLSVTHVVIASLLSAVVGGTLVFLFSPTPEPPPPELVKKSVATRSDSTRSAGNTSPPNTTASPTTTASPI